MPAFGPIKRRQLIQCLKSLGFEGPFSGGKHQFMVRGEVVKCLASLFGCIESVVKCHVDDQLKVIS